MLFVSQNTNNIKCIFRTVCWCFPVGYIKNAPIEVSIVEGGENFVATATFLVYGGA